MTDISEYRGKSPDELKDLALNLKKELFNLRFQVMGGEMKNTSRFRVVKRDIARVKTLLNNPDMAVETKKAVKAPKAAAPKKTATKKKASGE